MVWNNNRQRPNSLGRSITSALLDLLVPGRRRTRERQDRQRRGRVGKKAEWRTHRELEKLAGTGCYYVFSDLPTRHAGNMDHLVVGPEGLTIVESKANRGSVEVGTIRKKLVVTVGGTTLHRDVIEQVRAQMVDLCEHAGMKTDPDSTEGLNWLVCFPNGTLDSTVPSDIYPHLATIADLLRKVRAGERQADEEMVHSIASSIALLYGKRPIAVPEDGSVLERCEG